MGKQHFSGDKPKRRGPAEGGRAGSFGNPGRRGEGSFGGPQSARRAEGRPRDGERRPYPGRPAGEGERRGPRDGNDRSGFGRPTTGERRPGFGGDRDERPRRYEDRGGERPPRRDASDERPPYEPKPIWKGQPVRYEGKPTVPRGAPGERNRKFVKQDPNAPAADAAPRTYPDRSGRDERNQTRPDERPGGYDRPRRPAAAAERGYRPGERAEYRPAARRGGYRDEAERGPGGDDRRTPRGVGSERGEEGPRRFGDEPRRREEGRKPRFGEAGERPRSYGERPAPAGGTFRERREAMRGALSGPRQGTGYGRGKAADQPGEAPTYKNLKHYEADKTRGNKKRREEADFGTEEMRLNRYIANAGICSRREADALIAAGEIRVNGEVVTEMGYKVQPTDTVQYGKTNLAREKLVYVLLNKPKDFITTTDDPDGRKTVMDLVANASKERIFPVGRLDRNTTGLLLFTNDGEVAQKLSHPSHRNKKIYQVELDKPLTAEHLAQIAQGVELEDGKAEVDDVAVVAGNPHFVGVELHIGRNRVVRRIFEHLGYDVVALDRVQYAGLTKKDLPRGKWRFLTEQEVIRLKYFMK